MHAAPQDYVQDVREHYEELPYPTRDIKDEGKHFYGSDGFTVNALCHMGWAGKRDLRHSQLRVLSAGDGTGDGSIQFAETLHGGDAQIHAVDLSAASIAICKERLAVRQLTQVTHHHMSILDLPEAGLGSFDVIESSGVLHHLEDPVAGLKALASVLAEDGMMSIMVYATYGRTAVYMIQEMMRRIERPGMTRAERIATTRAFLDSVPNTHFLTVKNDAFLTDIGFAGGAGIFDLFLHSNDRSYTVPQLYEWAHAAGLHVVDFFGDHMDGSFYDPATYTVRRELLDPLNDKPIAERQAVAELMHGSMIKHNFYLAKQPKEPAQFADDMVIAYGFMQSLFGRQILILLEALAQAAIGDTVSYSPRPFASLPPLAITKRPATDLLVRYIDGHRSIGEIVTAVSKVSKLSRNDVRKDLKLLYDQMRTRQMVFLRHESVKPFVSGPEINARLKGIGLI